MALVSNSVCPGSGQPKYAWGTRTGVRTADDFEVNVGFTPTRVRVTNLTDKVSGEMFFDSGLDGGNNAKGLKTVAAGTRTYEAVGISLTERGFAVTVATAGLETDDDEVLWEAWAEGQG